MWRIAGENFAVFANQEFGEIPANVRVAIVTGLSRFKIVVQLTSVAAIHLYLGKHRKVDVVFGLGEFENFFIAAWFLGTKLVTGKS